MCGRHLGGGCHTVGTTNTHRSAPWARGKYLFRASTPFRTHVSPFGNRRCSVELGIVRESPFRPAQRASTGAPALVSAPASRNKSKAEPALLPWWNVRAWSPQPHKTTLRGYWECPRGQGSPTDRP